MPEGDTIFRAAHTLGRALGGEVVTGFRSDVLAGAGETIVGSRVIAVEARGKNLLIRFDVGRVLHTHLRMSGSWHIYRSEEPWRKPVRQARVAIETRRFVAVCFNAPLVRLLLDREVERAPILRSLGPDLLARDFDAREARRRLRSLGEATIGEALMIQSAVAGIGNVYKSETLFVCGVHPWTPVSRLPDEDIDGVLVAAGRLLSMNLDGFPRATRRSLLGGRHWVYGRSGRPCRRCDTTILMRRQGAAGRSTYWCPACQPG